MIPIFICDDELPFVRQIEKLIKNQVSIMAYDMGPVQICSSPDALLDEISKGERAIYFLDIDFPGFENGFELAMKIRKIDPRGFIIFITAHNDLVMETFRYRLEAMDYIVKGDGQKLKDRIQSCLGSIEQRICDEQKEESGYFSLKLFDTVRHIPLQQISFFEAIGTKHQIRIHMKDGILDFYSSLQQLEEELGETFWRCHRGFLVNWKHIRRIDLKKNEIELENQERCLLSRREKSRIPQELKGRLFPFV